MEVFHPDFDARAAREARFALPKRVRNPDPERRPPELDF